MNKKFKQLMAVRGMGAALTAFVGLIIIYVAFGLIQPQVFSMRNILNLLRSMSKYLLIGVGQSYLLITGNIDLSIGSVVGMTCMIIATMICKGSHPIPAILVAFAAALATGVINGSLVAKFKLPPFVATLGTQTICRGVAQLVNNNMNTDGIEGGAFAAAAKAMRNICYHGSVNIAGFKIYYPIIIALVLWAIFNFVLSYTRTGRHLYAIGSNSEASKLSGVNVAKTILKAYLVSAFNAGVVGLIVCAQTGTGTTNAGLSYETFAVAASATVQMKSQVSVSGSVKPSASTKVRLM